MNICSKLKFHQNLNCLGCNELSCTGWGVCEAACNSVGVRRRTCTNSLCVTTQQCNGPPCKFKPSLTGSRFLFICTKSEKYVLTVLELLSGPA